MDNKFDICNFILGFCIICLIVCLVILFITLGFSVFATIRYCNTPIEEIPTWVKMLIGNKVMVW